jgi:hypothetical protein
MEDSKIDQIAREVMVSLRKARSSEASSSIQTSAPAAASPNAEGMHPSLRLLSVAGGVVGSPCIIEPDKVCIGSLKCRTFGH